MPIFCLKIGIPKQLHYFFSVTVGFFFFFGLDTPKLPRIIFPFLVLLSPLPILFLFGVAKPLDE